MLLSLIPVHVPCFAVFADEQGNPEFRPVVSIGLMEISENKRLAAGFTVGDHIEPADFKPGFVAFSATEDRDAWVERCRAKREEMRNQEREAAKSKLFVPERKGLAIHA